MYFKLEKNQFEYTGTYAARLGASPHLHPQIELILITDGESIGVADDKREKFGSGDMFIVFPNQVHYYQDISKNVRHARVILSPDMCPEFSHIFKSSLPVSPVLKGVGDVPVIMQMMESIISCVGVKNNDVRVRGYALILLSEIFDRLELCDNIGFETDTVKRIVNYCYDNYNSAITLGDIASGLQLNKYYVSKLFNNRLHISFPDYINSLRVMHACELLKNGDITVSEVAYSVGYNSIRNFNRAFMNIKKQTPLEYKNNFKNSKKT